MDNELMGATAQPTGNTVEIDRGLLNELVILLGSDLLRLTRGTKEQTSVSATEKSLVERRLTAYRGACDVLGLGEMSEITANAVRLLALPLWDAA